MRNVAIVLAGALLSGEAAALEKCVGADGRITYSDKPCATGAKRTAMAGAPASSAVPIEMEYYDVPAPGGHQVAGRLLTLSDHALSVYDPSTLRPGPVAHF